MISEQGRKGTRCSCASPVAAARSCALVPEITDDSFSVLDSDGGRLIVSTNKSAPNGRIVAIDPRDPAESRWATVVPERAESLESAAIAGGRLFADLHQRRHVARLRAHPGRSARKRNDACPALGTATVSRSDRDSPFVFYTFTSFTEPLTIYRYDIAGRASSVFRESDLPGFDRSRYETKQVFVTSKDGTRVPMFLVHRAGLELDGRNPTLLYGYGGFNVAVGPLFNPLRLALLEQGFVYASVNLRGGSEYGETWHDAGTKTRKQNVFDDFIAAAEWLIANKYTSPGRLAITGGSNGGLLVGAVINQRPELFRAAVPQVGVMDMLRFHKFTIGWNWIADYGSSDNESGVQGVVCVFTAAQHPSGRPIPGDVDHHGGPRRPRGAGALLQIRRGHAGSGESRKSRADPHRNEVGARRRQHGQAHRQHSGRVCVYCASTSQ